MEWIEVTEDNKPNKFETILIKDSVSDLTLSIGHYDDKGFNDWVSDEYVDVTHYALINI